MHPQYIENQVVVAVILHTTHHVSGQIAPGRMYGKTLILKTVFKNHLDDYGFKTGSRVMHTPTIKNKTKQTVCKY